MILTADGPTRPDPDDLPRVGRVDLENPDGTWRAITVPMLSLNEARRIWRETTLEPMLLVALRARLAQLGG